jgi:hypothetical protein
MISYFVYLIFHPGQVLVKYWSSTGQVLVKMDDGSEEEFGAGDVNHIPPGHNAWVVGNESVVAIDVTGMTDFAKKKNLTCDKRTQAYYSCQDT